MTKYYFIGIGGIGMSGLALILKNQGHLVEGSDSSSSYITDILINNGIKVHFGHQAENLINADFVIYTSAINESNVEFQKAKQLNIPMIRRGNLLAQISNNYKLIAVAGSHGKTTTSSMLSTIFYSCKNASFYVGGIPKNLGIHAKLNSGEYFVTESDESDGSFLELNPYISIINNIDNDHLDYYKDIDNLKDSFLKFSNKSQISIVNIDDKNNANIFQKITSKKISFARNNADITYQYNSQKLTINYNNQAFVFNCNVIGDYNISNLAISISCSLICGLNPSEIQESIKQYSGVGRRLDLVFENKIFKVFDDYAHHPTEIWNVLTALRKLTSNLIAIWEPHRISRVEMMQDEFIKALNIADKVYITEIYTASEKNPHNVTTDNIIRSLKNEKFEKFEDFNFVKKLNTADTILVTLNAGKLNSITKKYFYDFK
jgi:UDP-N-acetylmuramate--alanine ligase